MLKYDFLTSLLILPVLYAETHYRFKYFFSWLYKREPEIIVDLPSRVQQTNTVPFLLIVKDAHRFPIRILDVQISDQGRILYQKNIDQVIDSPYQEMVIDMDTDLLKIGENLIDVQVRYNIKKKIRICINDNHRGTSHEPLSVHISAYPLPRLSNCFYGETHCHTFYTSDQVEFGASLQNTAELAKVMGFDFYCATDHSYDLDDQPDNYLAQDPELRKWKLFWQEVEEFNHKDRNFLIIPGEEVTLFNRRGSNIHCLVYNSRKFYPGSGDGAENWFHTKSELSVDQLLAQVDHDTLVFSAHPSDKPPLLQRIFINRGFWEELDCDSERLDGLQFINDGPPSSMIKGKNLWLTLLLSGKKLLALAGNDAHGNFNRFRQIGFPFFTMRENKYHLFGKWRTGVYLPEGFSLNGILEAFRQGNCFMTNGPALRFTALVGQNWRSTGGSYKNITKLKIESLSTPEYSGINSIKIFQGLHGKKEESIFAQLETPPQQMHHVWELEFSKKQHAGYLRTEIMTEAGYQAYSNPIWFL